MWSNLCDIQKFNASSHIESKSVAQSSQRHTAEILAFSILGEITSILLLRIVWRYILKKEKKKCRP